MTLETSFVVLFNCYATADVLTKFLQLASCFSLLLLYLGNSQVSVYRTIGPTLVCNFPNHLFFRLTNLAVSLLKRSTSYRISTLVIAGAGRLNKSRQSLSLISD